MIKRYANAQQVMRFIDRAEPDMSDVKKSEKIGRSPKRFYNYRRQERMEYETAERLLDCFDLGYLLHTGDIDITEETIGLGDNSEKARRVKTQQINANLRTENRYLRRSREGFRKQRDMWKARALAAEQESVLDDPPSPPNCTCKEDVKPVDALIVSW